MLDVLLFSGFVSESVCFDHVPLGLLLPKNLLIELKRNEILLNIS